MKKYIISTSIVLATMSIVSAYDIAGQVQVTTNTASVNANANANTNVVPAARTGATMQAMPVRARGTLMEESGQGSAQGMPARMMTAAAVITTGDATIDAQIKVLQEERLTKMKALNAEYDGKIKALIGDKKTTISITNGRDGMEMRGSTTVRMENRQGGMGQAMNVIHAEAHTDVSMNEDKPAKGGIVGFFSKLFH